MTRPIALVIDGPRARRPSRRSLLRVGGAGILGLALPSFPVQGQPTGHPILWTADWSPAGKYLDVGGNDGSLRVFSADLELLKAHQIEISMSRKGNPWDNAACESFMKTLKYEEVHRNEYRHLAEARSAIHEFLEKVYNQKRLHSALGYLPPTEFERNLTVQNHKDAASRQLSL